MMEPRILRIELPPGLPLLNANDRLHYRERSKRTEKLRSEAHKAAKAQSSFPFRKVRIRCIFRAPDKRRRDVANLYPSFKAVIDGALVDTKLLPDDSDRYITELCLVRGEDSPKKAQLILQVIEDDCG
jgi:crossover junction endodeoxyribonuclease RusA